jgi:hypothetical protein
MRMSLASRPRLAIAFALAALTVALNGAMLWTLLATDFMRGLGAPAQAPLAFAVEYFAIGGVAVVSTAYAVVGAVLANRPGAGRIAFVLVAGGTLFAAVPFGYIVGGFLVIDRGGDWVSSVVLLLGPLLVPAGFTAILPALALVFPEGCLPSPRLRPPLVIAIALMASGTLLTLVTPGEVISQPGTHNPFGLASLPSDLAGPAWVLDGIGILVIIVLGAAAVILRYRRGSALVRAQLRWFLAAVLLAAGPLAISLVPNVGGPAWLLTAMLGLVLVPVSIGIAILRYRLYDIDRIISRTLAYAVLTAILAGVYLVGFLGLQSALAPFTANGGPVAVAASTLAVFALFQPVRRRVQGAVDRRFYRSRYDAAREIESFAARVRDEVEVDRLAGALSMTLERTMQPATWSIWLRSGAATGGAAGVGKS